MLWCLFFLAALTVSATDHTPDDAVTSMVKVDRRSGKLVRQVVVPEKVITSKLVEAKSVEIPADGRRIAPGTSVDAIVEETANQYAIDPLLVHAIIHVESRYNQFAISPKGAEGLMQLIPSTARRMGVKNSFDSRDNIEGGIRYLRKLQARFDDMRLVLAAYNAGEEAVSRWKGIPPYAETQEYVYKVGKRYGELRTAQKKAGPLVVKAPEKPAEPEHRPLETFVDAEGRLNLRTR